ncbi:MAG TPA: hypothetical protein VKY15_05280, partial [Acidimicrobiales bacterium]|nr:hypothetical protein [Acidimicrobiales bacterium]
MFNSNQTQQDYTYYQPVGYPYAEVQMWGAGGTAGNSFSTATGGNPGLGGQVTAYFHFVTGQALLVAVGCHGGTNDGFPGNETGQASGAGGNATYIQSVDHFISGQITPHTVIAVAGGGGGGGGAGGAANGNGGDGGNGGAASSGSGANGTAGSGFGGGSGGAGAAPGNSVPTTDSNFCMQPCPPFVANGTPQPGTAGGGGGGAGFGWGTGVTG